MSYYRNSGIPRLKDYKQALDLHNNTKPIRGRTPELRPLGKRANTWYQIELGVNQEVICKQYGEPIVAFHSNGEIEIKDYVYRTISTAHFVEEVLGVRAYIHDKSLIMFNGGRDDKQYRVPDPREGSIVFKRDENYHNALVYVRGGMECFTHTINRQVKKELLLKHKDLFDYVRGMVKLREGEHFGTNISIWGSDYNNANDPVRSKNFKDYIAIIKGYISNTDPDTKLESWGNLIDILGKDFGTYHYQYQGKTLTHAQAVSGLEVILMGLHRDTVFDKKPIDNGDIKRDRYSVYWGRGWNEYHNND
jgi:hypothetical protein